MRSNLIIFAIVALAFLLARAQEEPTGDTVELPPQSAEGEAPQVLEEVIDIGETNESDQI